MKTGDGVTAKTITLGALTDMTGVYATLGKSVTQAQQLYVKQINAAGGICGRTGRAHRPRPRLRPAEGRRPATPSWSRRCWASPSSSAHPFVAAVKQRIDGQDKVLVLPQAWSASLLGSPYIRVDRIHVRHRDDQRGRLPAQRRRGSKKGDKIGHVYFEGDYGENALAGSKYAAEQAGLTVVEQKIKPTDNDMTAQVAALKQAGVKAVVISAGPRQAASLVGVAAAGGFNVPIIGNNSAFAPQLLATQAGPALSKDYWVASPTLPIGADTPAAEEARRRLQGRVPERRARQRRGGRLDGGHRLR